MQKKPDYPQLMIKQLLIRSEPSCYKQATSSGKKKRRYNAIYWIIIRQNITIKGNPINLGELCWFCCCEQIALTASRSRYFLIGVGAKFPAREPRGKLRAVDLGNDLGISTRKHQVLPVLIRNKKEKI